MTAHFRVVIAGTKQPYYYGWEKALLQFQLAIVVRLLSQLSGTGCRSS